MKVPYVFVTKIENDYIDSMHRIKNKKIAVFEKSNIFNKLKKEYPKANIIVFHNAK